MKAAVIKPGVSPQDCTIGVLSLEHSLIWKVGVGAVTWPKILLPA